MESDMYADDYTDEISKLVEEAHTIFNATKVSEVMDLRDRQSQEDFLNKTYNNPEPEAIERYLDVVKRLGRATYGGKLRGSLVYLTKECTSGHQEK